MVILACGLYRILEPKHLPRAIRVHIRRYMCERTRTYKCEIYEQMNISLKIVLHKQICYVDDYSSLTLQQ